MKGVSGDLELRHTITVEVDSLKPFLQKEGRQVSKFVLYLDHRPLKGLTVREVPGTNQLLFDVTRTPDTKDAWNVLLGSPFSKGYKYLIPVSIGYDTDTPLQSDLRFGLQIIRPLGLWSFVVLFVFLLAIFIGLARRTSMLRDARRDVPAGKLPPYSLGKTQMAFWFFLVLASILLFWLLTGESPTISESVLALLGISAGTALGAVVVTNSKEGDTKQRADELLGERAGLETRIAAIETLLKGGGLTPAAVAELEGEISKHKARIHSIDMMLNQESKGFWKDILTDVDGISLHRFQIAIWTLVLGWIFLISVYKTLGMPEFSSTLVALMGISAGTYIGFKFPEKQV